MRKILFKLILLIIFIFILIKLTNLIFPKYLDKKLDEFLKEKKMGKTVEMKITSPISNILKGKIDLEIKAKNIKVKDLNLEYVKTKFKDISIDLPEFFKRRKIKIKSIKAEDVEIKITEEDLQDYLRKEKGFENFEVELTPENAKVSGKVNFLGLDLDVSISGKFEIVENDKLRFKGGKIKISKYTLPAHLTEEIIKKTKPEVDLSEMKIPINLKEIKIKEGYLEIKAEIKT